MAPRSEVRARMVAAGADLISQRGYAVTMLDVIHHADAPRGSIYYHFPNGKPELAVEVAHKVRRDLEEFVAGAAERSRDPLALLRRVVDHHRKRLVNSGYDLGCPLMGVVASGEDETPELRTAVAEAFVSWKRALAGALESKGLSQSASGQLASVVVSALEGCIITARAQRSPQPFADLSKALPALVDALT